MRKQLNQVSKFLKERNWSPKPSDLAKSISIEAAELLELFQWSDASIKEIAGNRQLMQKLEHELADVFIYCFEMALALDINPAVIVSQKLVYNSEKYPAKLMRQHNGVKIYRQIKERFRKNNQV